MTSSNPCDSKLIHLPVNLTKVSLFLRLLSHPDAGDVQSAWWTQHTGLAVFATPFRDCRFRVNGCNPQDPAYVRCDAEPGANRAAVPNRTDSWPHCRKLLWANCGEDRCSSHQPIVYSFGIDNKWGFDDYMASQGFEVHSFDPTTNTRVAHMRHRVVNVPGSVNFKYWGLTTTRAACQRATPKTTYGALGGQMLGLSEIRQRLRHNTTGARIAVLKIE